MGWQNHGLLASGALLVVQAEAWQLVLLQACMHKGAGPRPAILNPVTVGCTPVLPAVLLVSSMHISHAKMQLKG